MIRIGAVGYGDIAQRQHFPDLKALAGMAELVAIQGRDSAALQDCARRFDVPRWHTDGAAILDDPAIDAVLVLTPPDSHFNYAQRAIRAGKHVLVEKPLARCAAEAAELADEAQRQQALRPVTCFPLPHVETAEHELVRRLLAQGVIGEVTLVECHRGHRGPTHAGWFYDRARAGGGVLIDLGIYQLSAVAALFGPALRMTASCTRYFTERRLDDGSVVVPDVEDSAMLTLALASGVAVSMNASWNGCQSHRATRARVTVIGREGMMYFGLPDRAVRVHRPDDMYERLLAGAQAESFDGYACRRIATGSAQARRSTVGDFVARIQAGDTSTRMLAIQAHVLEIVERAYGSAAEGIVLTTRF